MSAHQHGSAPADVAIVGYGPTGATLANLLGQAGLSVAVFDREAAPLNLPRAVHFDGEVARIFQGFGLADELLPRSRLAQGQKYLNPAGETLLMRKPSNPNGMHAWPENIIFHQPELEDVLRQGVRRYDSVQVNLNTQVDSIDDQGDLVALQVQDVRTGHTWTARARWVVACDGGRSMGRALVGGGMEDLGLHQPWLVVDVVMTRDVALPEFTIQHCDPARPTTYIHAVGPRRRWEIMMMPGDDPESIVEDASVWRLLAPWIQPGDAELERRAVYTFHALIAHRWQRGRLLLAGDAAHQTPPFLGQGLCAGARDAANLAWKLVAVCRGADASLLDSYTTERRPHVHEFIATAVRLGNIIQTTDPKVAAERDQRMREGKDEIVNLSPPLGPGAHGSVAPDGTTVAQPRLSDGRRLDDAIGPRFALCGPALERNAQTQALWALIDAGALASIDDPALAGWLADLGARWIVLRPDRYVLECADNAASLAERLARWTEVIRLSAPKD
ncbi:MAG: bifunctional 3-(3-hydroxy-phenyl)propionate/3-hydroxycinnamic acid hydroxylase [Burkholderiaceae bacterium]|jgi:3-(3-hydroxy-phenyl)propionate hydroxylase|nr:bifunctional 3-(3-hydroxy-phenyl)propionate/3-hydroxycinnamic acid hydroxylase [Burkholderiaceae bacterium]